MTTLPVIDFGTASAEAEYHPVCKVGDLEIRADVNMSVVDAVAIDHNVRLGRAQKNPEIVYEAMGSMTAWLGAVVHPEDWEALSARRAVKGDHIQTMFLAVYTGIMMHGVSEPEGDDDGDEGV